MFWHYPLLYGLFLSFFWIHSAYAELKKPAFEAWMAKEMEAHQIPSASLAIVKNYQMAYAKGFGSANEFTTFQAPSLYKSLTVMTALMLFEAKGLAMNTDMKRCLQSWKIAQPSCLQDQPTTLKCLLEQGEEGYLVIQQLIEAVMRKESYEKVIKRLILQPLDMKDSTLCVGEELWTTPTDLAKWMIAIQKALNNQLTPIPSKRVAEDLVKPAITPHQGIGFEININRYGDQVEKGTYFLHTGSNPGYLVLLLGNTVKGNGIVIMINVSSQIDTHEIAQLAFLKSIVERVAEEDSWF